MQRATSRATFAGEPALWSPTDVLVLFSRVDTPPPTQAKSAFWRRHLNMRAGGGTAADRTEADSQTDEPEDGEPSKRWTPRPTWLPDEADPAAAELEVMAEL